MDIPLRVDTGNPDAGAVSSIPTQKAIDLRCPLGFLLFEPEVKINAVGVVVHGEDFPFPSILSHPFSPSYEAVEEGTLLRKGDILIHQSPPSSGIDQVVEAATSDLLLLPEVEDPIYILVVLATDGETDAHLDPQLSAFPDSGQGALEGSAAASKAIVHLFQPV
jgi:hypothetical protein